MKIKEIIIEGLYNTFNHHIPLNQEEGITIIHSPNGFGKTMILRMIDGLFNLKFSVFRSVPFKSFAVILTDDSHIEVKKVEDSEQICLIKNGETIEQFQINLHEEVSPLLEYLNSLLKKQREPFSSEPPKEKLNIPKWFDEIRTKMPVYFIQSQRLFFEQEDAPSFTESVVKHSEELTKTINNKLAESVSLSQMLDRTFPSRLVTQSSQQSLSIEDLKNELGQLEQKRTSLKSLGLIDKAEDENFQIPQDFDESTIKVLNIYIQDVEKKLGVFEELAYKIEPLKRLINKKFLYKKFSVSKEKGFTFSTDRGESLSAKDLSSGEQHELILLYEMLFKVPSNSLILIDEPEISLHIVWQKHFLNDLREIIKLRGFDVLLATHSPHIIDDSWDLTVELKGDE